MVDDRHHLFHQLDVGGNRQTIPVCCFSRQMADPGHLGLKLLKEVLALVVPSQGLFVWIHDHNPCGPVHNNQIIGFNQLASVTQSQHRRDLKGPGDDAGMRGLAAQVCHEGFDFLQLDLGCLGRRKVMRHDNDPFINIGNFGRSCSKEIF